MSTNFSRPIFYRAGDDAQRHCRPYLRPRIRPLQRGSLAGRLRSGRPLRGPLRSLWRMLLRRLRHGPACPGGAKREPGAQNFSCTIHEGLVAILAGACTVLPRILIFRRRIQPDRNISRGDYTMRIRAALSVLCVTALAAGLVYAAPPGQIRVQVNLVNLFATVRDKHKAIVTGLKVDDFQVFEDGQPQEITNFSTESNLPITLGLLIHTIASQDFMLPTQKDMISRFLQRASRCGGHAIVMTFA